MVVVCNSVTGLLCTLVIQKRGRDEKSPKKCFPPLYSSSWGAGSTWKTDSDQKLSSGTGNPYSSLPKAISTCYHIMTTWSLHPIPDSQFGKIQGFSLKIPFTDVLR
jgi:hypothetical protein